MGLFNLTISAAQTRGARGLLGWSQSELAERAGVARATVADFERGARTPIDNNLKALRNAFEEAGIEFTFKDGNGEGVILR